ncbi:MAG: protein kinase [Methylophilaceae bacterium]|nr:protein kinase [Methylophilaceae bacterium]MDG1454556.1 protein kinase [Methylophilaceae bacterium]
MSAELAVIYGGYSKAGLKKENQDSFAAYQPTLGITRYKGIAACVADGVSCSENAQHASATSVTTFLKDYYSTPDSWDVKTAAQRVLGPLNAWLYHHGRQASAKHNALVTTFSSMVLKSNTAHIFHVGDSQILRLRGNTVEPLTRPHTHQHGNGQELLSRALGMDSNLDIDYHTTDIQAGDLLIATTDGVHGFISYSELKQLLAPLQRTEAANQHEVEQVAQVVVNQALAHGSDDNLTCFILRVNTVPSKNIEEAHQELTTRKIPPALKVGDKIDCFQVEEVIYAGTRSHLYQVTDRRDQQRYVLKVPSLNFAEDLVYLEGFVREQWVGNRIDHENIMRILPAEPNGQFLYHTCEEIKGATLRQWIHDHPNASLHEVRAIIEKVIQALRVFQRAGILHRDLKPENIMITTVGQVKLIDFGTVSVRGLAEINSPIKEDAPVGSVNYIAPETVVDGTAIMQSDLFSLAVIVYEMLAQALPYKMEKVHRRGAKSVTEWQYESLREYRPDLPLWLDLALEKACHPSYKQRYDAYSEFWNDLLKPNAELMQLNNRKPLLEQNGSRVWQIFSLILCAIVILQWYFLAQH